MHIRQALRNGSYLIHSNDQALISIITDQIDRSIVLEDVPTTVVSLVPSITELICDLAGVDVLVGRTKFCMHPESLKPIEIIGGTKTINIEKIKSLNPDLIIANKEENIKAQVEELMDDYQVWVSDVADYEDGIDLIRRLASLFDKTAIGDDLIKNIHSTVDSFNNTDKIPVAYMIWKDPYMTVGGDTYINSMINKLNLENVFKNKKRYPKVELWEIRNSKAEFILLSSEPYPFKEKHAKELESQLDGKKVLLVDGEFFSWYGSRITKKRSYLQTLLNQIQKNN